MEQRSNWTAEWIWGAGEISPRNEWRCFRKYQPRHGAVSHQNMFLVKTLRLSADVAETSGDQSGAAAYREAAEQLRQAINTHLWSEEHQAYIDSIHGDGRRSNVISMQTQVVAFLCGIAEGERKKRMEAYLAAPPSSFVPIGSAFMSFFYYEALSQLGMTERMLEDIRSNYGVMIRFGSSTCYEGYPKPRDGKIHPRHLTRSHCHAWSAAPGYFLGTEILGVRSIAPGWKKVMIAPRPVGGLSWANGTVPLPDGGRIDVSWEITGEGKTMELRLDVPEGTTVEFRAPEGYTLKLLGDNQQ